MKAIIIAAGRGKRMNHLTCEKPKCLLEFNGRKLLDIQLEALRANGIKDISIVVGYKKEKINYPDLKYYENTRYMHNDILHSLFCAKKEMDDEFIAAYSDILYTKDIIEKLAESKEDISIVVDRAWHDLYKDRHSHPIEEAENVAYDSHGYVVRIGKKISNKIDAGGEFLGLLKCTKAGADIFRKHFDELTPMYNNKPFQEASVFEQAYLTDMIQSLVDSLVPVKCVIVEGGWREIDTVEDYERAQKVRI